MRNTKFLQKIILILMNITLLSGCYSTSAHYSSADYRDINGYKIRYKPAFASVSEILNSKDDEKINNTLVKAVKLYQICLQEEDPKYYAGGWSYEKGIEKCMDKKEKGYGEFESIVRTYNKL